MSHRQGRDSLEGSNSHQSKMKWLWVLSIFTYAFILCASLPQATQDLDFELYDINQLLIDIGRETKAAREEVEYIQRNGTSIGELFEMPLLLNHISLIKEMATSAVGASNAVIAAMARQYQS